MTRRTQVLVMATGAIAIAGVALLGAWLAPRLFVGPLEKARAAYEDRDWSTASALARATLRQRPDDLEARRLMARSYSRMGRDDVAQKSFGRLDDAAMQAEDYFLLGSGLVRQDRLEPALTVLEKAQTLDRSHAETLQELARLYARLNRLGDAEEVAARLAAIPGWESLGGVILGMLRDRLADPAGASAALAGALRADPLLRGRRLPRRRSARCSPEPCSRRASPPRPGHTWRPSWPADRIPKRRGS